MRGSPRSWRNCSSVRYLKPPGTSPHLPEVGLLEPVADGQGDGEQGGEEHRGQGDGQHGDEIRVRAARRLFQLRRRIHFLFAIHSGAPYRATIRPSSIRTMRSAVWAISSLWVIITMVWANFWLVIFIRESTSWLVLESKFPVGSSARMMAGLAARRVR